MRKSFTVPLGVAYTTRVSAINIPDGTYAYAGVAIAGMAIAGKAVASISHDARTFNCFLHRIPDPVTGKTRHYLVKRPGWETSITPAAGNIGTASLIWTGHANGTEIISAFGATNSTIYNGVASLGAITGRTNGITESDVPTTTPTLLVASLDNTAWYYTIALGVMTKITDGDFPGNAGFTLAGNFVSIDGFAVILTTDSKLWASDLNTLTAWTANSFDTAGSYPDKGICCVRQKNFILAFGTESVQFFYNAGLTPFPFAKNDSLTLKVGCVSAEAITQISDTTFWCGSTPQGGLTIFRYDNGVSRISSPEVDSILNLAGAANIKLSATRFYGLSFVLVMTGTTTLVYCIEEKLWHEWNTTGSVLWSKCSGLSIGSVMVNYAVSNISTSGKVYVMNHASMVFADDGSTYSPVAQSVPLDEGTSNRKFYQELNILGDVEASSSLLLIEYSDDDYRNWSSWGTVDLSSSSTTRRATRLGGSNPRYGNKRAWRFTHQSQTPMRLEMPRGIVDIGTS